jgi:hypothetical protein
MKQEEQTCIENSHVYINASWLLVANDKEELQILALLSGAPFRHSFPLCMEIMDILYNDESLCFLKLGLELNNKLETSQPNISNLTLNPYTMHKFIINEACLLGHFMTFSSTCPLM